MDVKPKAQALEALSTARKTLESPEAITGVRWVQLCSLIAYAEEQIMKIEETKRPGKVKETP